MCNLGFWTPANAMLEIEDDIVDKMNVSRLLDEFMVGYDKERVPRRKWKEQGHHVLQKQKTKFYQT